MASSTNAREFRKAIHDQCVELYAGSDPYTRVVRGAPSFETSVDTVTIGAVTTEQEFAVYGATRQREESLTCEVIFYSFRFGGEAMEEVVEDRAWDMANQLAEYARVTDNTFGGVVREAYMSSAVADDATDARVMAAGRLYVIRVVISAKNRVRS